MNFIHDIVVVGGGVIAKAVALEMSARGSSVALISPSDGVEKSASFAAGAMLGSFAEFCIDKWAHADREEAKLRIEAERMLGDWFQSITEDVPGQGQVCRGTFIMLLSCQRAKRTLEARACA